MRTNAVDGRWKRIHGNHLHPSRLHGPGTGFLIAIVHVDDRGSMLQGVAFGGNTSRGRARPAPRRTAAGLYNRAALRDAATFADARGAISPQYSASASWNGTPRRARRQVRPLPGIARATRRRAGLVRALGFKGRHRVRGVAQQSGSRLCGNQILRRVPLRRLHAIDATPARWRRKAGSLPLDGASTAASLPRNDLVKNYRCTRHIG